ncbi:MAG: serine/threonine protein phosphatase [Lachnospiraceae bacterium]|nr:serine/threonine protein phosphatase [Lachnospiraceae bacterium]
MNTLTKLIIIEAVILGLQIIMYFGCEIFQHNFHNVERPIDKKVPLVPWTVSIYSLWFPMIALFPITLYFFSREVYLMYQIAIVISNVVSTIIYIVYPTTFERQAPPDTFWGRVLKFIYAASYKGINCAPSLHCVHCYITIVAALMSVSMIIGLKVLFIAIAAGIIISTQLTKQHVLIDAITALPFAAINVIISVVIVYFYNGISLLEGLKL